MPKTGTFLFLITACCLISFAVFAQTTVSSTFDADAEGWTVTYVDDSGPMTVNHNSSGGNPGGYVSSIVTVTSDRYWKAPSKFLGNWAYRSYGETLTFDLQFSGTANAHGASYGDVTIEGGNSRLVYTLPSYPGAGWTSFAVKLDNTTPWRWNSTGGQLATKNEIMSVLTNVTDLFILGNYSNSQPVASSLDNVVLPIKATIAPPVATTFSPESGSAGTSVTLNGSGFDTSLSGNKVFFGNASAVVTAASVTQIVVTVPPGAQFDKITVINTITGRITKTSKHFTPTFTGGGRIIPASMLDKI
ncbi:MAG: laminin B domain-containing protein, partial [Bacteroidota bacterium]